MDATLYNYTEYAVDQLGNSQWKYKKSIEKAKSYLDGEGVQYKAKILNVKSGLPGLYTGWSEQFSVLYGLELPPSTTTIFVLDHNPFVFGSRVRIKGFKGAWATINGFHNLDPFYGGNIAVPSDFLHPKDVRYFVSLQLDTSTLPHYDASIHGHPTVKAKYNPITRTSEYKDLVIALSDFQNTFSIGDAHMIILVFELADPTTGIVRIADTFQEIQTNLTNGNPYLVSEFALVETINYNLIPAYYYSYQNTQPLYSFSFDYTNPFGIDPNSPQFNYNIPQNYLDPATISQVYYLIDVNNQFQFIIAPLNSTPPGYQPLLNNQVIVPPYMGLVKSTLTRNRKIGYLYIPNFEWTDPNFSIFDPAYNPPNDPLGNQKKITGTIMQYFAATLNVDDIIIDNRSDIGGFLQQAFYLGSCFGTKRPGFDTLMSKVGCPDKKIYDQYNQLHSISHINTESIYDTIDPAVVEAYVPGSNFIGSLDRRRNAVLMTALATVESASFNYLLIGKNGGRDLGGNVHTLLVGNQDGRNQGGTSFVFKIPPLNLDSPTLQQGGVPIPAYQYVASTWFEHLYKSTSKLVCRFNNDLKPDHLYSDNFNMYYRDLGFLPPKRFYLQGPPNSSDQTTWADTWLEKSILLLVK